MTEINYRILDFEQVNEELERLKNTYSKIPIIENDPIAITRLGYPIRHFSVGSGDKHILIVAGTHGSEIISVDFALRLMENLSKKEDEFEKFSEKDVTIDFIPLHNPEGYIVSTSAVRTLITDEMSNDEIEKNCKEYYLKYKDDDIYSKNNPTDHTSLKKHQEMFKNADYSCISPTHQKLRESIKNIQEKYPNPKGSMICWRSNGSGVELNRNNPFYHMDESSIYGTQRYNNILSNVPGPIGVSYYGETFSFEPENKALFDMMDNLYKDGKYCGMISYHSTMGMLYIDPSYEADESILSDEDRYIYTSINNYLADIYSSYTGYTKHEPDFDATDEVLRVIYPAAILVELSKMGGNPIGPYGDIKNYERVMRDNMLATCSVIDELPRMQEFLYKEKILLHENNKKIH